VHRIALLDDHQHAAARFADWSQLPEPAEVVAFADSVTGEALVHRLRGFDVVVAMRERTAFPRAVLEQLTDLRLLVTTGMSNAAIDLDAARDLGVTVTGTAAYGPATAELTWALILAVARSVPAEDAAMRAGGWQHTVGRDLHGATLGLLGLGRLGAQVATVSLAFGMDVVAWSQNLTDEHAAEVGVRRVDLDDLLQMSDVVSIHLRLSDRTRGLLGARELGLLKPTAVLVNTSRGPIVDEAALVEILRARRIHGAGLDVYDTEPLPADSPLRELRNAVLTPHLGYVTERTYEVFWPEVVEDVAAWMRGEPVRVLTS
jgi:phosphoglycerate dehydrogenase-like enzyme